MLLSDYQSLTQALIQSPQSPIPLLDTGLLTRYINIARDQIAADGECVRTPGSATVSSGLVLLPLASLIVSTGTGYSQPLVARNATLAGARVDIRPWDWFVAYNMAVPGPTPVMAHQGQGTLSTLYISSLNGGALWVDLVALPGVLADDTSLDVIPFPWIDAVPFYAAWYAYMSFQRQADADMFMMRYRELMHRCRAEVTSTNLPENDPGGVGAQIAASKIPLGSPPAPPGRGAPMGR